MVVPGIFGVAKGTITVEVGERETHVIFPIAVLIDAVAAALRIAWKTLRVFVITVLRSQDAIPIIIAGHITASAILILTIATDLVSVNVDFRVIVIAILRTGGETVAIDVCAW